MNFLALQRIFRSFSRDLENQGVKSIYVYGSQVPFIKNNRKVPIGSEVDLVFVKWGEVEDGEKPISDSLAKKIFKDPNNIEYTFNGVWGTDTFGGDCYFFDLLSEGDANLKRKDPSAKVFLIKEKISLWGEEIENSKCSLSDEDKKELISIMSNYVSREFFSIDTSQNRKSIFKNAIFLISLMDQSLLTQSDRSLLIEKITSSNSVSKDVKTQLRTLINCYNKNNHKGLVENFKKITNSLWIDLKKLSPK